MAVQGDKARLYDVAFRMYSSDGKTLTDIAEAMGVSRQTLSAWKASTLTPGQDMDEWDRAKQQKRSNVQRLRALFDRELQFLEDAPPGGLPPASLDGITKLGTLVQRWEAADRENSLKDMAQRAALFLDFVRDLIEFFSRHDAAVVNGIEENFDDLIQWGRDKYR